MRNLTRRLFLTQQPKRNSEVTHLCRPVIRNYAVLVISGKTVIPDLYLKENYTKYKLEIIMCTRS